VQSINHIPVLDSAEVCISWPVSCGAEFETAYLAPLNAGVDEAAAEPITYKGCVDRPIDSHVKVLMCTACQNGPVKRYFKQMTNFGK